MAKRVAQPSTLPPSWSKYHTHIFLWHGCLNSDVKNIVTNGIDLSRSRNSLDFGRGFYTTTKRVQAEKWAQKKYLNITPSDRAATRPAVIRFRVPLAQLAAVESLMFVRGDFDNDVFWSLVHHCRRSTTMAARTHLHPARRPPEDWFDVVCGPLAAVWPPTGREVIPESDQFSFHTDAAIAILNDVINVGLPEFEIIVS